MTNDDRFRLDRIPATEDDWRDAVDGVLKGRPFEKVLRLLMRLVLLLVASPAEVFRLVCKSQLLWAT